VAFFYTEREFLEVQEEVAKEKEISASYLSRKSLRHLSHIW
jgi:hypothetical protein